MSASPEVPDEISIRGVPGIGMAFAVGLFFSFRIIIGSVSVRVLGTDPRMGSEVNLALNFLLLVLVCFHSLGEVRQSFASMLRLASVRWVVGFLVFSCLSLTWSSTALMPAAIAYWCAMGADVMMVALLLRAAPVEVAAGSLMKGFVWGACAIAAIAWLMPAQADLRLGDEEFFNSNQIGFLCAFAFFLAQYLMRRKEGRWGVAAFFLAITLLRSLSKTTIVAFVLSEGYLLMRDRFMSRKTKGYIAAGVAVIILVFWGLLASYYDVYTNAGNQAETLTGRTAIWAYVLNASLEQPWIGHGFNSMWKVIPPFGSDQFEPRHAENELLQQFYTYGIVGICLLAGLYGSLYRQFRRLSDGPLRILFVSMLLFIVIRGFAEAEPFDLLLPLWAIVLFSLLANELSRSGTVVALSAEGRDTASPADRFAEVAKALDGVETEAEPDEVELDAMAFDAHRKRLAGCGVGDGGRQAIGEQGLAEGATGGNTGSLHLPLQEEIELGAGAAAKDDAVSVELDPEAGRRGQAADGPGGEGFGGEVSHEV